MIEPSPSVRPVLANETVVAFEQAVAAPYCSSRLAQDGARVIKVERPVGDFARGYDDVVHGEASYFVWLNAGKQSIALDLRVPDDLACAKNIVTAADIIVQNLAPGALSRLGIDLDREREARPELITCSVSGYGTGHDYTAMKAYDLLIQAESGLCAVTGTPEEPSRVGISICDIATGMQAYAAILRAIIQRNETGLGESIEVSLFSSMAEWMTVPILHARYGAGAPKRIGLAHPSIAPYGVFHDRDGQPLLIAIQNDREWVSFADRLLALTPAQHDMFATNVARVQNRALLDQLVGGTIAALSRAEVDTILRLAGIAFAQLRDVEDVLKHPALKWMPVAFNGHQAEVPMPATGLPDQATLRVPQLNEHGAQIKTEFSP